MTDATTGTPVTDLELVAPKEGQTAFHAGMSLGQLAKTISSSGCFGRDVNPYVAAVKILAGQEIGLGPVESMRGLHVFDGKIELGSAAMSSKIKGSGSFDYEIVSHDENGCVVSCFEKSPRTGEWRQLPNISFTRDEASKAGLLNKKNWQNWFNDMTFARCMSRFFRRYCPHLAGGAVYAEGEVSSDLERSPEPPRPPQGPGGAHKPPVAPTEDAKGEAAINNAREVAEAASAPGEHPYARFIAQSDELKTRILIADLGVEDRYRSVFLDRGLKNRADVGKGHTRVQREILLELHDALKEAIAEKAEGEAEKAVEVSEAPILEAGMDPDVQPVQSVEGELPFA